MRASWDAESIARRARLRQKAAEKQQVILNIKRYNSSSVDCFNCLNHLTCFGFRPAFGQYFTCDGFKFENNN